MRIRREKADEFKALESAINRLKLAEEEISALEPVRELFAAEIESIRQNLKRPDRVEQVEKELGELKKRVAEYEQTRTPGRTGAPGEVVVFPPELTALYANTSLIGSGGFARVFRATRTSDGQEVALKVPISMDAETGRSFVREISSWQRLQHTNICRLRDMNILPLPYLEMELCHGSLNDVAKPMHPDTAAGLMLQIAEGVKYAHEQGVVHRDLKPRNVLFRGSIPVVTDWGLSKLVAEISTSSFSGFSPRYAAPEQISPDRFGRTDHRTDIYQLGAIFYELVTGRTPYEAEDITQLFAQITVSDPPRPSVAIPQAAEADGIIMTCLRREMNERYQQVAELQRDLAQYLKRREQP